VHFPGTTVFNGMWKTVGNMGHTATTRSSSARPAARTHRGTPRPTRRRWPWQSSAAVQFRVRSARPPAATCRRRSGPGARRRGGDARLFRIGDIADFRSWARSSTARRSPASAAISTTRAATPASQGSGARRQTSSSRPWSRPQPGLPAVGKRSSARSSPPTSIRTRSGPRRWA
jgi:hypothetical protein